ncbi:hypothetical protein DRO26_00335 [Candidatus Bathyarchaeota archaeon]|nr:MAG: hypothetical protein DRO26_00335 [Candidatus Bathyarchaeota archaeon]
MEEKTSISNRRIKALIKKMNEQNIDCYVCSLDPNIQYLTADSKVGGEGFIALISKNQKPVIYVSKLEQARIQEEVKNFDVEALREGEKPEDKIAKKILETEGKKVCFDSLTFNQYKILTKKLSKTKIECKPDILLKLREIKDKNEVELIKKATKISDKSMEVVTEFLRTGIREYEVAAEIEYVMRKMGSEGFAFKTIVASGFRSSYPHGESSDKEILDGEVVVVDIGAKFMGYNSDITRTFFVGKPTNTYRKIYKVVYEAQIKALENIRTGMEGWEADAIARKIIQKEGYGEYFIHGLGHGIGIEVHEPPRLSKKSRDKLKKMNVITVEPGIYLPKKFGVRIEDVVLVTDKGLEVLSKSDKTVY